MLLKQTVRTTGSVLATAARMGRGIYTKSTLKKPEQLLELYEFEGCPFCRIVRETLTELDLDAMIYPCPKGGSRFRPTVLERGGKTQFPYLVDPNTGEEMYESADIIAYLYATYADRPLPLNTRFHTLDAMASGVATLYRAGAGSRVRPSNPPATPLELFSIESSPFARLVRECLTELELPYRLRNLGRTQARESVPPSLRDWLGIKIEPDTENRRLLLERAGKIMVPYLIDPNHDVQLFESNEIIRYLEMTYAT